MAVNGGVIPVAGGLLGRKSVPNPQGAKCQRCLQVGHWTYECQNKRKYVHRSSRTSMLNKRLNQVENEAQGIPGANKTAAEGKKKKKKTSGSEGSSSSSDSDSSDSSDDSSDSSDSSSSDSSSSSSSSSSSEDSDSSSSDSSDSSSDSSSSSTQKKAKKKSKEKFKEKKKLLDKEKLREENSREKDKSKDRKSEKEISRKHQDLEKENNPDLHNDMKHSSKRLQSFLKPVDSDEEYDRRKSDHGHGSSDVRRSRKQVELESPERHPLSRKHSRESHRSERHDSTRSHFEECDRPPTQISMVGDSRERYERRKNSSVYWSKAGEEEEKKLLAENNLAKQLDTKSDRKKREHDHKSISDVSRRHHEQGASNEDLREKRKISHNQWSSERQDESNLSEEENHTQRFYENVEHGKRRHKDQDLYYVESIELEDQPRSHSRTGSVEDDSEEKIVTSSYWSYEMERMRKEAQDPSDVEISPQHQKKSSHKKKRQNVEEYSEEMNGSKKEKIRSRLHDKTEKEKMKTDRHEEKHISRKDERKHRSLEDKRRKGGKHAGSEERGHIDYDDFDVQGRNDFEPAASPPYVVQDSDDVDQRHAKSHSRKSKHKAKKSREFSEESDGARPERRRSERPPSPKRVKRSPEPKRDDKKSHNRHKHR